MDTPILKGLEVSGDLIKEEISKSNISYTLCPQKMNFHYP